MYNKRNNKHASRTLVCALWCYTASIKRAIKWTSKSRTARVYMKRRRKTSYSPPVLYSPVAPASSGESPSWSVMLTSALLLSSLLTMSSSIFPFSLLHARSSAVSPSKVRQLTSVSAWNNKGHVLKFRELLVEHKYKYLERQRCLTDKQEKSKVTTPTAEFYCPFLTHTHTHAHTSACAHNQPKQKPF